MTPLVKDAAAAPAERPPLLTIAAHLLPPEIVQARRSRKVRRSVISALVVFVALLVAWYGLAAYETTKAQQRLATAETNLQNLQRQQSGFADLISTQAAAKAISTQLSALLADDLQWSRLFASLQAAAPAGVTVGGVTGVVTSRKNAPGGAPAPAPAPAPGNPRAGGSGVRADLPIGTLTVTGSGPSKPVVAEYVDALAKVSGLANPLLSDVTTGPGSVQFTVRLDITNAALGGRFTSPSASPSASVEPSGTKTR